MIASFKKSLINRLSGLILFSLYTIFNVSFSATAYAGEGVFWKAQSPDSQVVYVFGTIHTDDNRVTNFSPAVLAAIKSSDVFLMETTGQNDSKAFTMQDFSLEDVLSAQELEQVYALAEFHVMHRSAVLRMKPWLLAALFDSPRPATPFAQDNLLMTQAEGWGKRVVGIETAQQHFGVMDDLNLDEQLTMLRAVLKRTPEQKARNYEQLIQAYQQGDVNKLAKLNSKITGSLMPQALWEKMRVKLLDERNVVMTERVIDESKIKPLFVAVGASHLAGETGLIAGLKRAGYQLTKVK